MTATTHREPSIEEVFKALADPTRIAVVERLGINPASTMELAQPFSMALPSFTQHLDVLERAGVISSFKRGRVRTYQLNSEPLERAGAWVAQQRNHWVRRFDQLDQHLANISATSPSTTPSTTKEQP